MGNEKSTINTKSLVKMLGELADLAENATLTGAMAGGAPRAVARYNEILKALLEEGVVPGGMFSPLPADAGYGDLAVDGRLLRAYIKEGNGHGHGHRMFGEGLGAEKHLILRLAPFAKSSDLRELVDSYLAKGSPVDAELIEALAPFLDSDHLGILIRTIAKRGKDGSRQVEVTAEASGVSEACCGDMTLTVEETSDEEDEPDALVHRDVPVEDRLRALTDRMRDPGTSSEEFEELAAEVLRLKQEQKHD
jgi:hypothetical protein